MAEGEIDYESDPEEAKLSLKLRRREASDDEEEDRLEKPLRRIDDSDGESEGAVGEYEEDLEEEEFGLGEGYLEEEIEAAVAAVERVESEKKGAVAVAEEDKKSVDSETGGVDDENRNGAEGQQEEESKDVDPFSVTAGAFYMHDDRFKGSAGGRHRGTLEGKKLWESKDDRKWGHDKFEELTMHERRFEESRRGFRGRNTGRGRNRATECVYAPVNRPEEYSSNNNTQNNINQSNAPMIIRGRGPRRYQQSFKNTNEVPVPQNKQSGKSVEKRTYEPVSKTKADVTLPRKQAASSLNIASPPFYPTGSSTKDYTEPLKRDAQAGTINRNSQQSAVDEKFHMAQSTAMVRENIVGLIGSENLYIDDSLSGKTSNSMQVPLSQLRGQEKGLTSTQMAYQPVISKNQFNRGLSSHMHNVQRSPGQSHVQSSFPHGTQRLPSEPQASFTAGAVNALESGEVKSASESKTDVVSAKGKGSVQGSGKGTFLYGGAQVVGSGHGDQNFLTFLPVMQFGCQQSGGIGVPAVGMAFPGYVAQPQLGLGSSEMTWLPVLAGAAGALGASYCPPFISMDGSYNARPSSIAAASSKGNNAAKICNDGRPAQRPEIANNDFGQGQKNPRRYTEMNFDQ